MSVWEWQTRYWLLVIFIIFLPLWLAPTLSWLLFPQASLSESFLFGAMITIGLIFVFRTGRVIKTMSLRFKIASFVMLAVLIIVLIAVMLKQLQ
jgi:hypothetical protein